MSDDTEPSQQAPTTTDDIDNQIAALENKLGGRKAEAARAVEAKYKTTTEAELTAEMGATFDKHQVKAEQETARQTLPNVPAKDLDAAFERTYDWMNKSDNERAQMTDARNEVQKIKDNAASRPQRWPVPTSTLRVARYGWRGCFKRIATRRRQTMSNNQSPQIDLELKGGHWHWRLTGDSFPTAFEGRARSAEEAAATAEHTLQMARLKRSRDKRLSQSN